MSQAPVMPLFTDALIGDTMHLTPEQFGCYMLILIATWRNNGLPFPDDDHAMAIRARVGLNRWRTKVRPVLSKFYDLTDGVWFQKRLAIEWKRVQTFKLVQSERGKRSGASKRLKKQKSAVTRVQTQVQPAPWYEPETNNPNPKPKETPSGLRARPRASAATISPATLNGEALFRAAEKLDREEADRRQLDQANGPLLAAERTSPTPGNGRS
jgi:uncharacterized protein YdaU (DUF1376 family)